MLVQHMGEVPDSLPVTEETRERLRAQANQLGEATVIRLVDLLAVAVEDMRQGGDPRLPLELALVKVTRPGADLSRESLSYRLEQLEEHRHVSPRHDLGTVPETREEETRPEPPSLELEQLQEAWQRTILPAVEERSIPAASVLREAHRQASPATRSPSSSPRAPRSTANSRRSRRTQTCSKRRSTR